MLHHELSLKLFVKFKRNAYRNQHTRGGYSVVYSQAAAYQLEESRRHYSYKAEEQRAEQNYSVVDFLKVIARGFTAADTLYRAAVLLQVSCYVLRVELYLRIEICEEYNQNKHYQIVEYPAYPLPLRTGSARIAERHIVDESLIVLSRKLEYHHWNRHKGRRKDDRHYA